LQFEKNLKKSLNTFATTRHLCVTQRFVSRARHCWLPILSIIIINCWLPILYVYKMMHKDILLLQERHGS